MYDITKDDTMTILIADDFAPIRATLKRMLEPLTGVTTVIEAADGIEAEQMIKKYTPDIVVLDIQMPGKTGVDLLRDIGPDLRQTRIIILTNFATPELRAQFFELGADHVLDKTMEFHQVIEIIKKISRA